MSRPRLVPFAPSRRPSRRSGAVALVAAAALLAAGCGSGSGGLGGTVVDDGLGCTVSEVDRSSDVPTVEPVADVGDEVAVTDETDAEPDACTANGQKYLTIDLVGADAADAAEFTNTFGADRPVTAQLGTGLLLPGLETGLVDMAVGQRRQVVIPAAQAYGAEGNEAQGIGPDEDLVFVMDLVAVTDTPQYCNAARDIPAGVVEGKPATVDMPVEAPTGEVTTTVLTEGDGPEATGTDYLTVNYLGVSCATGQQFDSSWDNGEPLTIAMVDAEPTATAASVIPGWTTGLDGQKQGSTVQIEIPFQEAYGVAGRAPSIGPSDPLVFIVEILEVSAEAPPEPEPTTTAAP